MITASEIAEKLGVEVDRVRYVLSRLRAGEYKGFPKVKGRLVGPTLDYRAKTCGYVREIIKGRIKAERAKP